MNGRAPVGRRTWFARARARVGGPIEAVCAVAPGGPPLQRLASATLTDEPSRLFVLVLTADELILFVHRERLLPPRVELGDELLRLSFRDIVRVEREPALLAVGFRVRRTDDSDLSLRAVRIHHGRAVVDRLIELMSPRNQ